MDRLKPWLVALFILLAFGIVGRMDYQTAVDMHQAPIILTRK